MRNLRVNISNIELQIREYEREGSPVIFLTLAGKLDDVAESRSIFSGSLSLDSG
jgi:hypothetical protein